MSLNDALWLTQMFFRAIIGVALIRVAVTRPGMRSLWWLAAVFCINAFNGIFITSWFMNLNLYNIVFLVVQICLVMFIHETFYQDRSSPYVVFLVATILWQVASVGNFMKAPECAFAVINPVSNTMLNWLWHAVIGYQAYKAIARDPRVEDWVKARYLLMVAYSLIIIFPQFLGLLGYFGIQTGQYAMVFIIISIIIQFFVWVMPSGFRKWLNRNYKAPEGSETELSDAEIMERFNN